MSSGEVSKEEVSRSKDYEEIRVGRVAGKGKSHKWVGGGGGVLTTWCENMEYESMRWGGEKCLLRISQLENNLGIPIEKMLSTARPFSAQRFPYF